MGNKRKPRKIVAPAPGKSLYDTHRKVAKEWHPTLNDALTPKIVSAFSNREVWWQCSIDARHVWKAIIARRSGGAKCGVCTNRVIIPGVNDLASQGEYAHIVSEWHPDSKIKPTQVTANSNVKLLWKCSVNPNHVWSTRLPNRTRLKSGCPECVKLIKRKPKTSAPLTEYPHLIAQWHQDNERNAYTITSGSGYKALWQCGVNDTHTWEASVFERVRGSGCPYCNKTKVQISTQNLALLFPDLVKEIHPDSTVDPSKVNPFSNERILWQCKDNPEHSWEAEVRTRARLGTGCGICTMRQPREPLTEHKEVTDSWGDSNLNMPQDFSAGSNYYAWWKCLTNNDHPEWKAIISDRVRGRNCPTCASANFASKGEQEIANALKTLLGNKVTIERHVRDIPGVSEIDIYIPERKVAIEFNGVYWHSDNFKTNDYHAEKSRECAELGIHLIHVWEDDWRDRRDIMVRALAHRLNVTERVNEPGVLLASDPSLTQRYGARTLVPGVVTTAESIAFLEQNHIQGKANGTLHTGLRDKEGILRAVFVAKRIGNKGHEGEWRIERYATRGLVPGGFTKLMKFTQAHIQTNNLGDLTKWVTFSDGALSDGGLYRNYGFEEDGFVRPDYMYVVNGQRVHKFNYRLKRFRDDPELEYNADMSERELALLNKIPRIWDSGKTRWVKTVK